MRDDITAARGTDTPMMAALRALVAEAGSVKAASARITYPAPIGELTIRKILLHGHRPHAALARWLTRNAITPDGAPLRDHDVAV